MPDGNFIKITELFTNGDHGNKKNDYLCIKKMKLFLINIATSVLLFLSKIRKKVTFNNIADFLEGITNSLRKKPQPLHIVISDPEGIAVAKEIHCYDIKEMYREPKNMPGLCPVCHNTIEKIPNLDYYTSTDKDIAITYDGFYIVRDRFKLFCEKQGYEGLRFVPLKKSLRHFYFMPEKIFQMDKETTVTMHQGEPCSVCGNYLWTGTGGHKIFSAIRWGEEDDFILRTEEFYTDKYCKSPLVIIGLKTARLMQEYGLKGFFFSDVYYKSEQN